jgi:importin subunit beta-1
MLMVLLLLLGRVCNLLPETVTPEVLPKLMQTLLTGLQEAPKIAANVCWAIHNMAQAVQLPEEATTSPMSLYFEGMMRALLAVTERSDVGDANLLGAAWEAINSMIHTAAQDVYRLIGQIVPVLIKRLATTLERESADPKLVEVQGLLCAALQVVIIKLDDDIVLPAADTLMTLFLKVMTAKSATVLEEALLAVGALANRTGQNFEKYMGHFRHVLTQGLKAVKEHHVCSSHMFGLVCDLNLMVFVK